MENANGGAVVVAREVTRRYGEGDTAVDALRGVSLEVRHGGLAAMLANRRERDALLDRKTDIRPVEHERQVVERRRDHWLFECGRDGGTRFAGTSRTCSSW